MERELPEVKQVVLSGSYKGYSGRAEYDVDAGEYHGRVIGIKDVVTFVGRTPSDAMDAFMGSVDDYLAFCKSRGEAPESPTAVPTE